MEKSMSRPRKSWARLALLLLTAVMLTALVAGPALAASAPYVQATCKSVTTSLGNRISFGADEVFVLKNSPSGVKSVIVRISNSGTNSRIRAYNDGGDWEENRGDSYTTFSLRNKSGLTRDEITRNIAALSVEYASDYYSSYNSYCEVKIYFFKNENAKYNDSGAAKFGDKDSNRMRLSFKNFAKGDLSAGTVGYEADNGNGTYLDGFVLSEGGIATGTLRLTDYGDARYLYIGYQVKPSTNTSWLNVETEYVINDAYYYYIKYWDDYKNSTRDYITEIKEFMEGDSRVKMKVSGLQAGVSYDIRGVIVSDGQFAYPSYTNAITVRYDKPTVNTFSVGSTAGPQAGGSYRDINLMATFNNTNYDNVDHETGSGNVKGAVLDVSLYFTDDFKTSQVDVEGNNVRVDGSKWSQIGATKRFFLQDVDTNGDPVYARTITETWPGVQLPEKDSKSAAYKVVVTDVISGYSVYSVSPSFVIDQNPPTDPRIRTLDSEGNPSDVVLGIGAGETSTVGGSNAKVSLGITGSTDAASGLKEYNYEMYYYSTEDGSPLGNTTEAVLSLMQSLNSSNLTINGKTATYTPATALKLESRTNASGDTIEYSTLSISKDGYYRVDVVAKDGMGLTSNVVTTLFRVDLSLPSTPEVVLTALFGSNAAAVEAGHPWINEAAGLTAGHAIPDSTDLFFPYDNRTYTTNAVWACLYTAPKTGKTIAEYQYSRDGGLTWFSVPASEIAQEGTAPVYYTRDTMVSGRPVKAYNDNYTSTFNYNAAIAVSNSEVSGYQSYIFRSVDTLGNTSLASEPVIMRVTDQVQPNSVLNHQGIEVAMSLGDTDVQSSLVTPELKNRAARKINKNFYGEEGSTTIGADDFNPYLYTKDHDCVWAEDDPGCTTACTDPNCPYAEMQAQEYAIYLPEMVNVQGISQQSAQSGVSNWIEFDHTTAGTGSSVTYAGNYNASGTAGVTFSTVLYEPAADAKGKLVQGRLALGDTANQSSAAGSDITYVNRRCQARARHFVDYSTLKKNGEAPYSTILAMGYGSKGQADFKFLENDQSAKKSITFSFDINACDFHTYLGGGFFYNSTVRKNGSTWVLSGYALYVYQSSTISLYKITNYPVTTFCGQGSSNGGGMPGSYGSTVGSVSAPSGQTYYNFNIITEGTKSSVYWIGGSIPNGQSPKAFEALRKAIGNNESAYTCPNGGATSSYAKSFVFNNTNYIGGIAFKDAATGRPTVGSSVPGDTNLYGFGPFIQYDSHNCSSETSVFYTNISMNMNVVRKLSEVVTEPHWGSGKSKYILNINNEPTNDFEDPAMATAIQWRLNNDNARFIGWGKESNRAQTQAFLDRIRISADTTGMTEADAAEYLRAGTYQTIESHGGDTYLQLDDIAEYISRQYFGAFGVTDFSKPVAESMKGSIGGQVPVYALEDAGSINFEVTPSSYNTSTANADYPSGRWYIIHDVRGYDDVTPISRNRQYSDALDLVITKPGRYMIFFAPTEEDVKNNTLNPADAVFHFIVTEKPVARFGGQIVASEIQDDGVAIKNSDGTVATTDDLPAYLEGKWQAAIAAGTVVAKQETGSPYLYWATDTANPPTAVTEAVIGQTEWDAQVAAGTIATIAGSSDWYETHGYENYDDGWTLISDPGAYKQALVQAAKDSGKVLTYNPAAVTYYEYAATGDRVTAEEYKTAYEADHIAQKDGVVRIVDNSGDPDTAGAPKASEYSYTYTTTSGKTVTAPFNKGEDDAQLNGVYKTEWSYDIVYSEGSGATQKLVTVGTSKDNTLLTVDQDGWTTQSLDGMTVKQLVTNPDYADWDNLADGAVLTVYQRITDISARLEAKYNVASDGSKTFIGYRYVNQEVGGKGLLTTTSQIAQRNISATSSVVIREITSAPLSAMTLSSTTMYDTATGNTAQIKVTRSSSQPQNKDFALSWAMPVGGSSEYTILEPYKHPDGKTDYYLHVTKKDGKWVGLSYNAELISGTAGPVSQIDPKIDPDKNTSTDGGVTTLFSAYAKGQGYTRYAILTGVKAEECNFGSGSGEWTISKGTIQTLVDQGIMSEKTTVLQINESIKGYEATDSKEETVITDRSARAIGFKTDTNPPIAQTVSVSTKRYIGDGDPQTDTAYDDEAVWKTQTYQASNYLDITAHDAFNRLTIGGSADNEGALGGYGYYFYTTKVDPTTKNTVEDKWYNFKLENGVLTKTAYYAAGSTEAVSNALIRMPAEELTNNLFTVDITEDMIGENEGSTSFNVAVFAYDTQTGRSTYTGANQSAVTRVENVKLTQSTPMPPAIKVTDAMNNVVTQIGNDAGFIDAPASAKDVESTGTNSATGESMNYWSNTEVTVQFQPRQGYFLPDEEDGNRLVETSDGTGTLYYMDKFHQADLTNMAEVTYTLETKQGSEWQVYSVTDGDGNTVEYEDIHINAATTLAVRDNGEYRVTATITNGAGIQSVSRQVHFNIDASAPTPVQVNITDLGASGGGGAYNASNWTSEVSIRLDGSTDNNADTAYYTYSLDNGATWVKLTELTKGAQTLVVGSCKSNIPGSIEVPVPSGEYQLRIKAVDRAGNESAVFSQTIKIDVDGPVVNSKDIVLNPTSAVTRYYKEFIVNTSVSTGKASGSIWPVINGSTATDTVVSIPTQHNVLPLTSGSQLFKITPAKGYTFHDLLLGGVSVKGDVSNNGDGTYSYTVSGIKQDTTLSVSFQSQSRSVNSAELQAAFAAAPIKVSAEAKTYLDGGDAPGENVGAGVAGGPYTIQYGVRSSDGAGQGSVEPTTAGTGSSVDVAAGSSETFTITPGVGSRLVKVVAGPKDAPIEVYNRTTSTDLPAEMVETSTGYNYTFTNIGGDAVLVAYFEEIPVYKVTVSSSRHGTVTVSGAFASSTSATGETVYSVYQESNLLFALTPDKNYSVSSILLDGAAQEVGTFTGIDNVSADHRVEVTFDVAQGTASQWVNVTLFQMEGDSSPHGSCYPAPEGEQGIKVAYNDSLSVRLIPDAGYNLAGIAVVDNPGGLVKRAGSVYEIPTDGDGNPTGTTPQWVRTGTELTAYATDNGDGSYTVTINHVTSDLYSVTAYFQENQWSVTKIAGEGGSVTFEWDSSSKVSVNGNTATVSEGATLRAKVVTDEGFRLSGLTVDGAAVGAQSEWEFANISSNHSINATFVRKELAETRTTHAIVVEANNIHDEHDKLAAEAYCFRLRDKKGTPITDYSAWQSSSIYTFTGLDPNTQYIVDVEARDAAGNTTSSNKEIYTLANIPTIGSTANINDANSDSKSVRASVNANGNPEGTLYMIYYSERADMQSGVHQANSAWQPLSANGTLDIGGLSAGRRYYLQIRARNGDGKETGVDEDQIASVLLSPTSPPANSLYVTEQEGPMGGVTLTWAEPAIEVTGFILYRDGVEIRTENKNARSYTDPYGSLAGDRVYTYTYAYVNAAGIGSSRVAVTKEYHNAGDADRAKMDTLSTNLKDDLIYNEVLTYPAFPTGVEVVYNSPENAGSNSGKLQVRVQQDETKSSRYGKYVLGLRAYAKNESTGVYDVPITEDSQFAAYGADPANYGTQTTVTTGTDGPIATWTNLNTDFEYEVYVVEVISTGKANVETSWETVMQNGKPTQVQVAVYKDGYLGKTKGVEGSLLKTAHVTESMYWTEYGYTGVSAMGNLIPTQYGDADFGWTADASLAYTGGRGWNTAMDVSNIAEGAKIKFNKTPHIELPLDANQIYDDSNDQVVTENGENFLLIDKTNTDTEEKSQIIVRVAAWDEDGGAVTVSGRIGGTKGADGTYTGGLLGKAEDITAVHTSQDDARADYYDIVFDGRQLSAGVYDTVVLSINDGQLERTVEANTMKIVVNQALPNVYITGGNGTRKIELGGYYNLDDVIVTSTSLNANVDAEALRPLRLTILKSEYAAKLGSYKQEEIVATLTSAGTYAAYKDYCQQLLGSDYNDYLNASKNALTTDGALAVIDRVQLEVDPYFEVTKEAYDAAVADGIKDPIIRSETTQNASGELVTRYWMDTDLALARGVCQWAQWDESMGKFKVTGELGHSYALQLVTYFGRNSSTLTTYFKVLEPPKVTVESHKIWGWQDAVKDEYIAYRSEVYFTDDSKETVDHTGRIIQDAYDRHEDAQGDAVLPDGTDMTEKAYRVWYTDGSWSYELDESVQTDSEGNPILDESGNQIPVKTVDRYEVFRLVDENAAVGKSYIAGNVNVDAGIYDKLNTVGILLTNDATYNPNTDGGAEGKYKFIIKDPNASADVNTHISSGRYAFQTSGLQPDTNYYLWTYYTFLDYHGVESAPRFEKDYVVITTGENYDSATYAFNVKELHFKEAEADAEGKKISVEIDRLGDRSPSAKIKIGAEYFEADEYGNILLDENGLPKPLASAAGGGKTLLQSNTEVTFTGDTNVAYAELNLYNDGDKQGHMVVRLTLAIDYGAAETSGYNYLASSGKSVDIFVLDDESPVTNYKLGLRNEEGEDNYLTPATEETFVTNQYEYTFPGLQVGYTISSELVVTYFNAGTGDLSDIKIDIYDEERHELSKFFMATQPPHSDALAAEGGELGTVRVMAKAGLPDGVHYAWLRLYAKDMEERDEIWIKVCQVVGQSTLKGRVYIGQTVPTDSQIRTGSATLYLYSGDTTYDNATGTFSTEPLSVVQSNAYGGQYTIPNILNNGQYYLVIKREGFITYNGVAAGKIIYTDSVSRNMELNIRLLAGDICGADGYEPDGVVDQHDLAAFSKYYHWDLQEFLEEKANGTLTAEHAMVLRCDFNGDAYLNNLDIASIYANMNKSSFSYTYDNPRILP